MKFILLLIITMNLAFSADEWKVVQKGEDFFVTNTEDAINHEAILNGTSITLRQVKVQTPDIDLVIYDSGQAGTKVVVSLERAIVYDKRNNKVLGDFPYQYKVISPSTYGFEQPVWKFEKDSLKVTDENSGLDQTIKLP